MEFSREELNRLRQMYDSLCDIAPQFLEEQDHMIGRGLREYFKKEPPAKDKEGQAITQQPQTKRAHE